jgi:alkylhydroperoxidase family enzyme
MSDLEQREREIVGKPPRIAPLRAGEMGEAAQTIAARISAAAGSPTSGEVPEIVATLLRHPGLYEKHVALGTELLGNGTLPARQRELAVLRTGWLCGAPYEWGEHVAIAKRAGLTTLEIERVTQGSDAPGWSDQDRAVLRAAEELHQDATISDATWSALETFLDERQLIELPYLIGNYTKVAYLQNALRLRLRGDNRGLSAR